MYGKGNSAWEVAWVTSNIFAIISKNSASALKWLSTFGVICFHSRKMQHLGTNSRPQAFHLSVWILECSGLFLTDLFVFLICRVRGMQRLRRSLECKTEQKEESGWWVDSDEKAEYRGMSEPQDIWIKWPKLKGGKGLFVGCYKCCIWTCLVVKLAQL